MANLNRNLGFLLNDITRLLRRNFDRRAQALDLSQGQWRALVYLTRQEGVNQATLAESLDIQPITLVRHVDKLQKAGLVDRRPDPTDRRAFQLYLTEAARPLLVEMKALALEARKDAMAGFSDENIEMLYALLEKMKENLADAESCRQSGDTAQKDF